jgi:hypothetical protein
MKVWQVFVSLLGILMLLGLWTERSIEFWATYTKGVQVDVSYWIGLLASLLGPLTLVFNIGTEIARAVM